MKKALLIYSFPTNKHSANTILEYIYSLKCLPFDFNEINTFKIYDLNLIKQSYDIVILHYSLFGGYDYLIDKYLLEFLKKSSSFKIAIFQDEHHAMNKRLRFIKEIQANLILTSMFSEKSIEIYRKNLNKVIISKVLTGYVTPEMKRIAEHTYAKDNLIFYRARKINLGRGALEKFMIGEYFLKNYSGPLTLDIDFNESGRLYGRQYTEMLEKAKFSLGAEAGTNLIVFEPDHLNSFREHYNFEKKYAEIQKENFNNRMISPRIFENIAYGVVNILIEGEYSGVIKPWIHYIPVKKDFSNFLEVLEAMNNHALVDSIVNNGKHDIIHSGYYDYNKLNDIIINATNQLELLNTIYDKSNLYEQIKFYFWQYKYHAILNTKRLIKNTLNRFFYFFLL